MSLEASVARSSDIPLKHMSRSKSCKQTADRELSPDDIVLSTAQTHEKCQVTELCFIVIIHQRIDK